MKKSLKILLSLIIILLCVVIILNNYKISKLESKTVYNNNIKDILVSNIDFCDYKPKLYYEFANRKIYTYCIDSVKIFGNDNVLELKDYLKNYSFNHVLNFLDKKSYLWDGGTEEFKDREAKKISLINCHTLEGNRDIYIGDEKMQFKANFCKDYNETFTKIYTIDKIENYKVQQYEDGIPVSYGKSLKVTLKSTSGKKTTVILNNIFDDLKINKTYEFEFELNSENDLYENGSDKDIFEKYNIVEIREVKKQ